MLTTKFNLTTLAADTRMAWEVDLPDSPLAWLGWLALAGVGVAWIVALYLRDTNELHPAWKVWLLILRLGAWAGLLAIAVNPQERTETTSFRPSRVAIAVDTSLSMQLPEKSPDDVDSSKPEGGAERGSPDPAQPARPRADAVRELLERSPLIAELQKNHDVSVFTFDSTQAGPHWLFKSKDPRVVGQASSLPGPPGNESKDGKTSTAEPPMLQWEEILKPRGVETRLGESLLELVRQVSGKSLSGVIVISDGAANSGIDPASASHFAEQSKTRLVTVGVGGTKPPVNLAIASVQAPTDAHLGDPFEITAFVQAEGLAGKAATVELLSRPEGETSEPSLIESKELALADNGVPIEVTFKQNPATTGSVEYLLRAKPVAKTTELSDADNERRKTIRVTDRKTKVLLFAGGPMRDYVFVKNMLFRHSAIEVDVLLQTADPGTAVSQEGKLIFDFPKSREELFPYDVIVAFDPDWRKVTPEQQSFLREWVFAQSGGLILVAGDVNTSSLASGGEEVKPIQELCPVTLSSLASDLLADASGPQAWPIGFSRAGLEAGFLQLTDEPISSAAVWKEFPGIYRCYPTAGAKAGATVFANFADPRSETSYGAPIWLAAQFYGSGRTLYVGAGELWRLRAIDEDYFDRFWTKAIRELSTTRLKRGTLRGMLLLERNQYLLGQTAHVRALLSDAQFQPLTAESVNCDIYDPSGRPLLPPLKLLPDRQRPGQFVGDFRLSLPGTYRLELTIPDSTDKLTEKLDVSLPNLETANARQNVQRLRAMAEETGGAYLQLDENTAAALPKLLPNHGEEFLVDERLRTLWDRDWVMYVLVGLLSVEWLTRKLLKLA
jgi:hypothetical protein